MKKGPSTHTETRGTGITARDVTIATAATDKTASAADTAMARSIMDAAHGGRARIAHAIVQARAILRRHRLPTDEAPLYVQVDQRKHVWRRARPCSDDIKLAPSFLPLLVQKMGYAEDSPAGYAARFLRAVFEAEIARRAGDWESYARENQLIGALLSEVALKEAWERDALRGRKNSESLAAGGARANSARRQARDKVHRAAQEKADELWGQRPKMPAAEVARHVKKMLGLKEPSDTIRKWLRHPGGKR